MDTSERTDGNIPEIGYHWHPIEDLPEDWPSLANAELAGWMQVWRDQRERLKDLEAIKQFNERLSREWSIETGIIEGLYTLDRGTTVLLIEKGFQDGLIAYGTTNQEPDWVLQMLRAHEEAMEGLLDFIAGQRELTTGYIKQLHAVITSAQETAKGLTVHGVPTSIKLLKGEYKQWPNSPMRSDRKIHQYCPPEHVAAEMDKLVAWHRQHLEMGVPPEIEAAWLHHRFVQIHPFQDGNGRVARCLSSLVFLRVGVFPTVVSASERDVYIDALDAANEFDLKPLVDFFSRKQISAIKEAAHSPKPKQKSKASLYQIIDAGMRNINKAEPELEHVQPMLERVTGFLETIESGLTEIKDRIEAADTASGVVLEVETKMLMTMSALEFSVWLETEFGQQWMEANGAAYEKYEQEIDGQLQAAGKLTLHSMKLTGIIVIGIRGTGRIFSGFEGISSVFATIEIRMGAHLLGCFIISEELFYMNYAEDLDNSKQRFGEWLDRSLAQGLFLWFNQHR